MKNADTAFSFCLKVMGLAIFFQSTLGSPVRASTEVAHSHRTIKKLRIFEDKGQRLAQAKELLGSHYRHSVVRFGEQIPHVKNYLAKQVEASLPKKYKAKTNETVKTIFNESKKYGFDPLFVLAVMTNESRMNPDTRGQFGEIGLMQIKPDTAEWISKIYHLPWKGAESLTNIKTNIRIGTAYLDYLREKFDNHSRLYLSAYNMGPSNVKSALSRDIWPKDYVIRVMDFYVKFYADLTDHPNRKPALKSEDPENLLRNTSQLSMSSHSRRPQSVDPVIDATFDATFDSADPMQEITAVANDQSNKARSKRKFCRTFAHPLLKIFSFGSRKIR